MRPTLAVTLALAVVASALGAPVAGGTAPPAPADPDPRPAATAGSAAASSAAANHTDACAPLAVGERPDPEGDVLGWENGCWHNESLTVDRSDGLNETERDAVVGRSMARVEQIRRLEFNRSVPVEVISREEYGERIAGRYENVSDEERLFHNVLAEARFFADEETDWVDTVQKLETGVVGGFYSPTEDRLVVISDNTTSPKLDELTLAHELVHALQDQRFDLWDGPYVGAFRNGSMNIEDHNRYDAVAEGDANYVQFLYDDRCGDEWDCLLPEDGGNRPVFVPGEYGAVVTQAVPYTEGEEFVVGVQEEGGWAAVNGLYRDPPASTEQVIHPEKYGEDAPSTVTVEDRSGEEWRRFVPPTNNSVGGIPAQNASYGEFGEGGVFAMFIVPSYAERERTIVKWSGFFTGRELNPLDYASPVTTGWDGDKLVVYVREDSLETNETGYVWKTVWDSVDDAEEFAAAYVELLEYHGAEAVRGRADTYRISDVERFDDAFYVNVSGEAVTIVNAPTVEDLRGVRAGAAPEATVTPTATATATATPTLTPTATEGPTAAATPTAGPTTGTEVRTPGFGFLAVLAAIAALALLARRR